MSTVENGVAEKVGFNEVVGNAVIEGNYDSSLLGQGGEPGDGEDSRRGAEALRGERFGEWGVQTSRSWFLQLPWSIGNG